MTGLTGPAGTNGTNGAKGDTGDTGLTGSQGIQGVKGDTGLTGPQGETGPAGTNGTNGVKGDTGDTGLQGIQGVKGETGPAGTNGTNGVKGDTGDTGSQGIQGVKGETGTAGTNGTNGDIGPQGIQGVKGDTGLTGPTGPQGEIGPIGLTGLTGAAGTNGTNGAKGDTGDTGLTGSQGIQGVKGDTGLTGPQGETGPAGTNGTNGVKGDTGDTGLQGIQGVKGDTGSTGADSTVAGPKGDKGDTGTTGVGIATSGTAHQTLTKIDGTNFNTQWETIDKTFVGLENVPNLSFSGSNTGDNSVNTLYSSLATSKQDTLVSGTNIKTINGASVLSSGDLTLLASGGALGTPTSGVATNLTGTAANLTAGHVTGATLTTALTNSGGIGTLSWPAGGATLTIPSGGGTLGTAAFTASTAYLASGGTATAVTGATFTKSLIVNGGNTTVTGNADNTSVLTVGSGAVSVSGSNTGDNANTTGSAAKWTTARNLAGNSVDGSGNVAFANKFIVQGTADTGLSAAQFLGALGTGIVKNTTSTGVLTIATGADLPVMTATVGGAVPTPPNNTTMFLRGDGTWVAPTAGMTNPMTTLGDLIIGGAAGAPGRLADVAAGSYLVSGGVGAAPTWSVPTFPSAAGTAGNILTSDGTNWTSVPRPDFVYNQSVAAQGPGFAADTYLTGSNVLIPANALKVGSRYHMIFNASKTAVGTATPALIVRFGTAGAIGDAALCTLTFTAQTAATDTGTFEVWVGFRTVGASAVMQCVAQRRHGASVTGFGTLVAETKVVTSSAFNSTVANSYIGVSANGGTSAVWTVTLTQAELSNTN